VFGKRSSGCPLRTTRSPRFCCRPAQNRSRNALRLAVADRSLASSQALPSAAVSSALSVPARRPLSWLAP
jgi:hypothetical protein